MFRDILDFGHEHSPLQAVGWYLIWIVGSFLAALLFSVVLGFMAGATADVQFFVSKIVVAFSIIIIIGTSLVALEKKGELSPDRPIYILLIVVGGLVGYFGMPLGLIVPAYFTTLGKRNALVTDKNIAMPTTLASILDTRLDTKYEPIDVSTLADAWRGAPTPGAPTIMPPPALPPKEIPEIVIEEKPTPPIPSAPIVEAVINLPPKAEIEDNSAVPQSMMPEVPPNMLPMTEPPKN